MHYVFWNNKGGTGKTSLCFQSLCRYAEKHPDRRVLAIDACPQANLSEILLGSMTGRGAQRLLQQHGALPRKSLGGYFQLRLPSPFTKPAFRAEDFIVEPCAMNNLVPANVHLVCGDPLLEMQANAMNTLSNMEMPGTDTWGGVISWIADFIDHIKDPYDAIFIDCNPSFSIYTQIALASAHRLIVPVMADDSSRRAIQNASSLLYGLALPSPIYTPYAFSTKLSKLNRMPPCIHLIVKNRITQYMGENSAFDAIMKVLEKDVEALIKTHPQYFTFGATNKGMIEMRDFQSAGAVAFAKGTPFSRLRPGKHSLNGYRVQVQEDACAQALASLDVLVDLL